jgi:hypothetical protein
MAWTVRFTTMSTAIGEEAVIDMILDLMKTLEARVTARALAE